MNKEETKEAIKVMQAYVDGKNIEFDNLGRWMMASTPVWNWDKLTFRIAEPKPVEIEVGLRVIHNDHRRENFYIYRIAFINAYWVCYSVDDEELVVITLEGLLWNWHTIVNGAKCKLTAPEAK